ncbi:cation:proton antiporter [Mariprofundus sp. KV]|uniref:cation:proton antiporter n=1 Tax=Mariprofundus sp. KV TaxID=2608715 RepID=UPI0015A03FA8|nr:cation:proton antiporter [Mariprofundus sp. KV]NWF35466.1 cation:proton antiporter [Mariprofundus sp. KV]
MIELTQHIEMQMSLLLFTALGGYLLSSWMHQPGVVGQILLGLIIGPSVLGWVTYTDFVANVATLGAVILLFVTGLEFKLRDIVSIRYAIIALSGVIVPWVGGYFLAIGFGFAPGKAILLGVALTATSIAITADVLRELGKLQSETAKAIIGAAILDDILALLALSVSIQLAEGSFTASVVMQSVVAAILFLVIGALMGVFVFGRLIIRVDATDFASRYPDFVFAAVMMIAFLYAMIAEMIGLSAIVGAFVAGVSLEAIQLRNSRSFREGAEYLRVVFGSIFFISLGVLADVRAFDSDLIWFVLALTMMAIATKLIGCGLPAWMMGIKIRDALIIGVGMMPRGEVAMVVALLALQGGVIAQPAYVAIVLMSLLTTLIVPLLLRNWLYRGSE